MGRVGLELYLEMLEQAVNKIKNGGVSLQIETELNLGLTAISPRTILRMDGNACVGISGYPLLRTLRPARNLN